MTYPRVAAVACVVALATGACLALPAPQAGSGKPGDSAPAFMSAEQIADRSVQARGGLEAWRKIATIIWTGHLESPRANVPNLPFRLEEKKPGKSRFEINEPSQRSLRVFNGTSGWKMKLDQDGRPDVKPFSAQEIRFARSAPGLEGPLIDFRTKGSTVEWEGTEELEGRPTYRIGVRLASGEHQTVWIDAGTFLEARYDRTTSGPGGAKGTVSLRVREYREVEGLAVPSVIEISGAVGGRPDRMLIERVALNPEIDDRDFDDVVAPRGRGAAQSKA